MTPNFHDQVFGAPGLQFAGEHGKLGPAVGRQEMLAPTVLTSETSKKMPRNQGFSNSTHSNAYKAPCDFIMIPRYAEHPIVKSLPRSGPQKWQKRPQTHTRSQNAIILHNFGLRQGLCKPWTRMVGWGAYCECRKLKQSQDSGTKVLVPQPRTLNSKAQIPKP